MSKQWYYQAMGSEIGPLASAALKQEVRLGHIQPDTLVRLGLDGEWQAADRIKGLLDPPMSPAPTQPAMELRPQSQPTRSPPAPVPAVSSASPRPHDGTPSPTAGQALLPAVQEPVRQPATRPAETANDGQTHGFDFLQFVGFENSIGTPLYELLCAYCRTHRLTLSQATQTALAEFLGRKDLAAVEPPPVEEYPLAVP